MGKHTPGDWKYRESGYVTAGDKTIALMLHVDVSLDEQDANGAFIASVPALAARVEMLEGLLREVPDVIEDLIICGGGATDQTNDLSNRIAEALKEKP